MTQEIPQQDKGYCDECYQQIRVEKKEYEGLVLSCGCEYDQSIRVSQKTPGSWQL